MTSPSVTADEEPTADEVAEAGRLLHASLLAEARELLAELDPPVPLPRSACEA